MTSITVLMPCLNPGHYLNAAIASALEQPELTQLVIADGGSDAESLEQLEQWRTRDKRVEWFSEPDHGPADALNKALARAKGAWIGWLNADDVYQPGALGRAIGELLRKPELLMVYGHGQHIDATGEFLELYPTRRPEAGIQAFQKHCFICQPTAVINKKLLERVGGFNPECKYAFDLDLWLRIFADSPKAIGFIEAVQASTRIHENSITARQQWQINLECANLLQRTLGKADSHWAESAAIAYTIRMDESNQREAAEYLLKDPANAPIKKDFEIACRRLGIQRKLARKSITIRKELPEILQLLITSRPDLLSLNFHDASQERMFCQWLISIGTIEYSSLFSSSLSLSPLFDWLLKTGEVKGLTRLEQGIRDGNPEHQREWKGKSKKRGYRAWLKENWNALGLDLPNYKEVFENRKRRKLRAWIQIRLSQIWNQDNLEQGINLIGYATYSLGIGEDLRTCYHSLKAVNIPTKIVDFPPGDSKLSNRREDSLKRKVEESITQKDFTCSIICLTAEETMRWELTRTDNYQRSRGYIIGYWPWELPKWPPELLEALTIVNEVWVSTEYIAKGLRAHTDKPIQVMPLCVETPQTPAKPLNTFERLKARELFNLPIDHTLFCFSFDLNSYIERKNPWACVQAFQQAFPPALAGGTRNDVGLMIKTYPPKSAHRDWDQLKELCLLDPRVHLMETNLTRSELLQLYGCCDAFLSLHRAEGFGRGIAEALQLGLDVVATDWSGNTDFCKGPLAHPVPYELVPVKPGAYPHWPDQVWAEPSIKAAAEALRKIDRRRRREGLPAMELSAGYRQQFSASTCGARYRKRLEELGLINEA